MRLALSDDQKDLVGATRVIVDRTKPQDRLRRAYDRDDQVEFAWPQMVEQGLASMAVPEDQGGLGWATVELALVFEECGYGCLPDPLLEHIVACRLMAESSSPLAPDVLASVVEGGQRLSLIAPAGDLVHGLEGADNVVWCSSDTVELLPAGSVPSRRALSFDRSRSLSQVYDLGAGRQRLGGASSARRGEDLLAILSAAELLGTASRLFDMTLEYVLYREQFGAVLGSNQSVKHALAECYRAIEVARPQVWAAALGHDRGEGNDVEAYAAKVLALSTERLVNDYALQFHGAIGFAWESDLHFWLKRGKSLEVAYGSFDATLDTVATRYFASGR